ncbi:hypothetical protein [Oceanisphaera sediminis]
MRPADDTLYLHRQLGRWQHRDIAEQQRLELALQRWPLLAELVFAEAEVQQQEEAGS